MAMQAVIMAGGAGMRLRPMTCDCPKPLVPLCGAPVMDYALRLLARYGYDCATATLCYRPQDIKSAFGEGRHGVTLCYSEEKTPLGTAGSVLHALEGDADTVLVLSGDGLTGCDLSDALRFHQRVGAAATLVLKSVDIPLAYGVVATDERGRILRFIEKPDWSRVVSSQVNTGVYLLEREALALIPRDRPFDFGRELFPLMLQKGMPLYGYPTRAYWCDVGDPAALLRAQGFRTAAMALRDDSVRLDDPRLMQAEKLAVVMGTEGDGLADATIAACDFTVRIPMHHGVDSLNVAAASAVAFYQLGRRA